MPKRRNNDHQYNDLCKKLRKIEKEIQRDKRCRRRRVRILSSSSSSSSSSQDSSARQSEPRDSASPIPTQVEYLPQDMAPPCASGQRDGDPQDVSLSTPANEPDSNPAPEILEDATPPQLDAEILQILGVDPTKPSVFGKQIQNDVAVRFEHIATTGLTKEDRKELTDKYLVPENCKLVGAPALNPEIKAALSEMVVKRDKVIETKQSIMTAAISSLGQAITALISSDEKNTDLLRLLMDTGRTLSDCQHNDTVTRRNFVLYAVKKDMKESLQNTKVDNFLFGEQLSDTLKAAKAISKSGADLKAPPPPKPTTFARNTPAKNWKRYNPSRKNAATKKDTTTSTPTTSSTTTTTRSLRPNSYRQSQNQRPAYKSRY